LVAAGVLVTTGAGNTPVAWKWVAREAIKGLSSKFVQVEGVFGLLNAKRGGEMYKSTLSVIALFCISSRFRRRGPRRSMTAGMPPLTDPRFANGYRDFLGDRTRLPALRKRFEAIVGPVVNKATQ
jgi:hypothetical protein